MVEVTTSLPEPPLEAVDDYGRYMRRAIKYFLVAHLYTKTRRLDCKGIYNGAEPEYTIYLARQENEYPPILIIDNKNLINPKNTELCLQTLDTEQILDQYLYTLPNEVEKELLKLLNEHLVYVKTHDEDGNKIRVNYSKHLAENQLCFQPVSRLRDTTHLKNVDWPLFIEKLIHWESTEKDYRLNIINKAQLLKGINPRLNAHSLIVLNAGVGKSIHFIIHGANYDKVKKNSFLGFAKSPKEIYKGTVDGSDLPVGIDQIESGEWSILDFMFNVMEYGEARVSSGSTDFAIKSKSSFSILANPIGEVLEPERSFGNILTHISDNPAIGRRFGIIAYSKNWNIIKTRSTEISLDQWREASGYFRAIEQAAKPELKRILSDPLIWSYITHPIPGYEDRIKQITDTVHDYTIKAFLNEHGQAGQNRVRCATLQASLVDHLKDIALGEYNVIDIIDTAEEYLGDYVSINLESVMNIAQNIEDELETLAKQDYDTAPDYLKEIINAVETQRRNGLLGNTFLLSAVDYKTTNPSYQNVNQCSLKLLKRKGGVSDVNNKCRKNYRFDLAPYGKDLKITLLDSKPIKWLEIEAGNYTDYTNNAIIPVFRDTSPETEVSDAGISYKWSIRYNKLVGLKDRLDGLNEFLSGKKEGFYAGEIAESLKISLNEVNKLLKILERENRAWCVPGSLKWRVIG